MSHGQPLIVSFAPGEEPGHFLKGNVIRYIVVDLLEEKFFFSYPAYEEISPTERFYFHHHSRAYPYEMLQTAAPPNERLVDSYARLIFSKLVNNQPVIDLGPRPPARQAAFRKAVAWAEGSYQEPIGENPVLSSKYLQPVTRGGPGWYGIDGYMIYRIYIALDRRFVSFVVRTLVRQDGETFLVYPEERLKVDGREFWDFLSHPTSGGTVLNETLEAAGNCVRDLHEVSRMDRGWPAGKMMQVRQGHGDHGLPHWLADRPAVIEGQRSAKRKAES